MNFPTTRTMMCIAILALAALPVAAKDDIFVDYDHDVDFSTFKTFAYGEAKKGMRAQEELTDQRIVEGIVERMIAGGLQQVDADADPDLVVTYQLTSQTGVRKDVTGIAPVASMWGSGWGWGAGFGPGWGYGGGTWFTATSMTSTYAVGSLLVAAFDTSTKLGVWRGTAKLKQGKNPLKTHQKIDKALDKMGERWRHMHKGD